MGDLTKLDFENSFCGREKELKTLKDAFQNVQSTKQAKLFSIEGASGSGKSKLVETFHEQVLKHEDDCYFGRGKMEEGRSSMQPFDAFVDAVQGIIQDLNCQEWYEYLQSALRDEQSVIEAIMPFGTLCGENHEVGSGGKARPSASPSGEEFGFERLQFAFLELFRALATRATIVLCLDDLHHCSPSMFRLLESLLQDSTPRKLLLIEMHRPVNADSEHALNSFLGKQPNGSVVRLGALSEDEIVLFLSKVLRRERAEVSSLAVIVRSKTAGNAFFVRQLLGMLQENPGILYFSLQNYRWEWDIEKIQSETNISDNVVDLVLGRLQSKSFTNALMMAALLRSTHINVATLRHIMDEDNIETQLEDATKEGLLEKTNSGFKFSHDRILEACSSLLPTGTELTQLHLKTGRRIHQVLGETPDDNTLFQTVYQLNKGSDLMESLDEKRELAKMNIAAAEAANHRSSYFPAAALARNAIKLLGNDPWSTNRSTMLSASILLCRVAYCCGEPDESIVVADSVLQNSTSLHARNIAAHTKLLVLDQQRRGKEGFDLLIRILGELGIAIPRRFVKMHVMRRYFRVRRLTSGITDTDVLNLPEATDVMWSYRSEFLVRLGELAISWGLEDYLALGFLIAIELTLTEGRIPMTSLSLLAWGTILAQEGSYDQAYRYGQLALQMAKQRKGGGLDDRTVVLYYTWIQHWREPFVEGVEPSSKALKTLWDGGSLEAVFMDTESYLRIYFVSGLKLEALESDIQKFLSLCSLFKQEAAASANLPFFQMVSNLVGKCSKQTVELSGSYMDQAEFVKDSKDARKVAELNNYYFHGAMVAYFFNEYTAAWKLCTKITQIYHEGPGVLVPARYYFKGLVGFGLAREAGNRRAFRAGRSALKQMEKFVKAGVSNCHHYLLVLRAEQASILQASKPEVVRKAYDEAILAAGRLGYLYDTAIANERAGIYHLNLPGEESWAATYLSRAATSFLDWEAHAKVKQLQSRHSSLLEQSSFHALAQPEAKTQSKGLKGKARLGELKAEDTHTLGATGFTGGSFEANVG